MVYDFDTVINRLPTSSLKWSYLKRISGMEDILPLWIADMDFASPPEIVEAMKERVAHPLYGYTLGSDGYYDELIKWMERRHGWSGIQRDWICYAPGVVSGFNFAIQAYSHPGDKIVIQPPVYYVMKIAISNNGRQMVENPLKLVKGRYVMDYEDLEKKIDGRTKMIILCSPHNPVGRVWKRSELEQLVEVCERKDIIIVSDEIHMDLVLGKTNHTCISTISEEAMQRTVTLLAPSKTFNLAGLANSNAIIPNKKLRGAFSNVAESHGVHFPNIFGMVAQEAAYAKGEAWLGELLVYLRGNLKYLEEFIKEKIPGLKVYPLEGTFLAWVDCSSLGMDDAALKEFMMKKAKLWFDEGTMFGSGGSMFMRINIGCPRSILKQALERLEKAVKKLTAAK
jgi:cystathionine beta-lyase